MAEITLNELRELTPKGYNLVAFNEQDLDPQTVPLSVFHEKGVPIKNDIKEPEMIVQALAAASDRYRAGLNEGKEHQVMALVFHDGGYVSISYYKVKVGG